MSLPLISVAIVTYNQKEFLRECIESCLSQDYPNIEIVVADDCSTDGTQEMLFDYKNLHPNKFILKFSDENKGITVNANVAHFACSGKYIAWMGGDDLMLPGKISRQVEYMENNPNCTICYHDLDVFDSASGRTNFYFSRHFKPREGRVDQCIKYGTFNGASSTMVRAERAPKEGFDLRLPVASDWLYWVESLANGGTINYIEEVLGRYRRHVSNITQDQNSISQGELDHLVSCQILIARHPRYIVAILSAYSNKLLSLRYKLPYFKLVLVSFLLRPNVKALVRLTFYVISFGKAKL